MLDQRTERGPRARGPDLLTRVRKASLIGSLVGSMAASLALSLPSPALAQGRNKPVPAGVEGKSGDVEGAVLALDKEEIIVDLGAARGAAEGVSVELWRTFSLRHPVTKQALVDRFRLGELQLVQVRGAMALARPFGSLLRPAAVGDVVVLAGAHRASPPSESPAAPADKAIEDPEVRAVTELFDALKGQDPATRIKRYEEYAQAHPEGRFAAVLSEEAQALRKLFEVRAGAAAETAPTRPQLLHFAAPEEMPAGAPLRIAVELDDAATGAVLHVRKKGAPAYTSIPMKSAGHGYFAAVVPEGFVVAPGLEYFIEATAPPPTRPEPVVGEGDSPKALDVVAPASPRPGKHIPASVRIGTDYADYNRLRGNDRAWQTEGDFGLRFGDTGLRAMRIGFGVYRGVGGGVHDLDQLGLRPRSVGLTYGYLEGEFGIVPSFSGIARGAVGLDGTGINGGIALAVRIGSDLRTNLVLGAEALGAVGARGFAELNLATFNRFPITLRTEVSDQPMGTAGGPGVAGASDIGVRGIAQLGFKATEGLLLAVRGSFQGRTIQHAGPGLGGAVSYSW